MPPTLTSADVVRAVSALSGAISSTVPSLLHRADEQRARITLLSAWRSEEVEIGDGLSYELDVYAAHVARYRELACRLCRDFPGLELRKGTTVGDLYPPGWLRETRDVDLVAPGGEVLWECAVRLVSEGFAPASLGLTASGLAVAFLRPAVAPFYVPFEKVELSTFAFFGSDWGTPRMLGSAAAGIDATARRLLDVVAERFERPYCARDLIDASLLLGDVSRETPAALRQLLDDLSLWPEWCELVEHLLVVELPCPGLRCVPSGLVWRSRARRAAVAARRLARPGGVRKAALRAARPWPRGGTLETPASAAAVANAELLLRGGLVSDVSTTGAVNLVRADGRLCARTPVGVFALSAW